MKAPLVLWNETCIMHNHWNHLQLFNWSHYYWRQSCKAIQIRQYHLNVRDTGNVNKCRWSQLSNLHFHQQNIQNSWVWSSRHDETCSKQCCELTRHTLVPVCSAIDLGQCQYVSWKACVLAGMHCQAVSRQSTSQCVRSSHIIVSWSLGNRTTGQQTPISQQCP